MLSLYFLVHLTEQFCCSTEVIIGGPATLPWRDSFHYRTICNQGVDTVYMQVESAGQAPTAPAGPAIRWTVTEECTAPRADWPFPKVCAMLGSTAQGLPPSPTHPAPNAPPVSTAIKGQPLPHLALLAPSRTLQVCWSLTKFSVFIVFFSLHEFWVWREMKLSNLSCVCYFMWWKFVTQRLSFSTG